MPFSYQDNSWKTLERRRAICLTFIDLEKPYIGCLVSYFNGHWRKTCIPTGCILVRRGMVRVRSVYVKTTKFSTWVGLPGSLLEPFFSLLLMNNWTTNIQDKVSWFILFVENLTFISLIWKQVNDELEL